MKKSVPLLYTNNKLFEIEINKTSFPIVSKNNKIFDKFN